MTSYFVGIVILISFIHKWNKVKINKWVTNRILTHQDEQEFTDRRVQHRDSGWKSRGREWGKNIWAMEVKNMMKNSKQTVEPSCGNSWTLDWQLLSLTWDQTRPSLCGKVLKPVLSVGSLVVGTESIPGVWVRLLLSIPYGGEQCSALMP